MSVLRECGTNWAVEWYSCRMSLLCVVRDALGSGGVLLLVSLLCVVRDALGSGGVLLLHEFVMCSAGRTGQWRGTPAG